MIEPEKLGKLVVSHREKKGWSQDDLVHELRNAGVKVSKGYVSKLERGEAPLPRMDMAHALDDLLGLDLFSPSKLTA